MSIDIKHSIWKFLNDTAPPPDDKDVKLTICAGGKLFGAYHVGVADEGLIVHYVDRVEIALSPSFVGKYQTPNRTIDSRAFIPFTAISWISKPQPEAESSSEPAAESDHTPLPLAGDEKP